MPVYSSRDTLSARRRARSGLAASTAAAVILASLGVVGAALPSAGAERGDRGRNFPGDPAYSPSAPAAKAEAKALAGPAAPGPDVIEPEIVDDQLLVLVEDVAEVADVAEDQGVTVEGQVTDGLSGSEWVAIDTTGESLDDVAEGLADDDRVLDVQPNYIRTLDKVPTDPDYQNAQKPYLDLIRAERAWDIRPTASSTQVIAVIDSGVLASHPDLSGRVLTGRNLRGSANDTKTTDTEGHGTLVAGIAAAGSNNGQGIAGIASGAKILPVKVFAGETANDADIAQGIRWAAANGADVIVMSFGGPSITADVPILQDAIDYARGRGVVLVASTGNDYRKTDNAPASLPGVIGVGAVDDVGHLAKFSTWGPSVDVVAPGIQIAGPYLNNAYVLADGTSFSAPIVAGVVALMRTKYPTYSPSQIERRLMQTARDTGPLGRDEIYGAGIVDAAYAVGEWAPAPSLPSIASDANDFVDEAQDVALALGATVSVTGGITEGDSDWFTVTPDAGVGAVTLTLTSDDVPTNPLDGRYFDAVLEVYDAANELIQRVDTLDNEAADESVALNLAGAFKVRVLSYNGSAALQDYTLTLTAGTGPGDAVANPRVPEDLVWVSDTAPNQHGTGAELGANLTFDFLRSVNPATVGDNVRLIDGFTGSVVPASVSLAGSGESTVMTVNPTTNLLPRRNYRVIVEGLVDTTGIDQVDPVVLYFSTQPPGGSGFTAIAPRKVLETRATYGGPIGVTAAGKIPAATDVSIPIAGVSGIPSDATAVVVNVTAVKPASATTIEVRPDAGDAPAARMPVAPGAITRMLMTLPLGSDANVVLRSTSSALDVTAEATGYYGPSGKVGFTALTPTRILTDASLGSKKSVAVSLYNKAGIPTESTAVLVNVTIRKSTQATWVAVSPQPSAGVPTLVGIQNATIGATTSNLAVVQIGSDRKISVYNNYGTALVSVDVVGAFSRSAGLGYRPITPVTVLESRAAAGGPIGFASAVPMPASSSVVVSLAGQAGIGADAAAVVVSLAAEQARASTTLAIGPNSTTKPPTALTATTGKSVGNLTVVSLAGGKAKVWSGTAATDVVANASGWFAE